MTSTRRSFMVGCSSAIAAMAGGRVSDLVFGNNSNLPGTNEIFVLVFLRGGCDGLSLVAPYTNDDYKAARQNLALPETGDYRALLITPNNPSYANASNFGLHPASAPLHELYTDRSLAIVHACGLNDDTRSHFDAMDYIERGTPGNKRTSSGWLARHLECVTSEDASLFPTLATGSAVPDSLLTNSGAVAMSDANSYGLSAHWRYNGKDGITMLDTLSSFYGGSDLVGRAGKRTIEAIQTINELKAQTSNNRLDYEPTPGLTYPYPENDYGGSLKTVAQMIKLDLGLRSATVDLGGWDTHENQGGSGQGYFAGMIDTLSRGLHAFYNDLAAYHNRLTVVVMSEFGRRLGVNQSAGTDHGHGAVMLVLGGNVNGGKLYGTWPGLAPEQLDQQQDLRITTDFRTVLGEIVVRRLGNNRLGTVFPGITPTVYSTAKALNIVKGTDMAIDYSSQSYRSYLPVMRRG